MCGSTIYAQASVACTAELRASDWHVEPAGNVVSAAGDPAGVVETVRRAVAGVDASVPVLNIRTLIPAT